jgi:hypothetical protein
MPGNGPHVLIVWAISRGRIRETPLEPRDPAEETLHPLTVRTSSLVFMRDSGTREDQFPPHIPRDLAQAARIVGVKTIATEIIC